MEDKKPPKFQELQWRSRITHDIKEAKDRLRASLRLEARKGKLSRKQRRVSKDGARKGG